MALRDNIVLAVGVDPAFFAGGADPSLDFSLAANSMYVGSLV